MVSSVGWVSSEPNVLIGVTDVGVDVDVVTAAAESGGPAVSVDCFLWVVVCFRTVVADIRLVAGLRVGPLPVGLSGVAAESPPTDVASEAPPVDASPEPLASRVAVVSPVWAEATPTPDVKAKPIPNATAKPPTRPIYADDFMRSLYQRAGQFPGLLVARTGSDSTTQLAAVSRHSCDIELNPTLIVLNSTGRPDSKG